MRDMVIGFMLGAGLGLGLLLSPKVRQCIDKTSTKIENKIEKIKKASK